MAQPSIVGPWLFDIVGVDKGAAVITFNDEGSLSGYGLTLDIGALVEISGSYTINSKGVVNGHFVVEEESLDFTGKVDKKVTKLNLKVSDGPNLKGIKLPSDPTIPGEWKVKISGGGSLDPFTIKLLHAYHRVYEVTGSGVIDGKSVEVFGLFILDSKSIAYGYYELTGELEQEGTFSGKINLASKKFSFKAVSREGDRGTLSGVAK
jgi:hypothetical protein